MKVNKKRNFKKKKKRSPKDWALKGMKWVFIILVSVLLLVIITLRLLHFFAFHVK